MNSEYSRIYSDLRDLLAEQFDNVPRPRESLYGIEELVLELDESVELSRHNRFRYLNQLEDAIADYLDLLDVMTIRALDLSSTARDLNEALDGDK